MNMTSLYPRLIEPHIAEALLDTPVVLLAGPRQAGKTTLVRQIAQQQGLRYLTMDDARVRVEHIGVVDLTMPADAKITNPAGLARALRENGYAVGFANGYLVKTLPELQEVRICDSRGFVDYAGRPAVAAFRMCPVR